MNIYSITKKWLLTFFCVFFSSTAACNPASIATWCIHSDANSNYQTLINRERALGNKLIPKRVVRWFFEGKEGEFMLADVLSKNTHSCVVFMLHKGKFLALGGNNNCTWTNAPEIIRSGNKAWIDFRQVVEQNIDAPMALNEFTAHFLKGAGAVCMLGLPNVGYESLRCPEDEAPESQ